MRLARVRSLGRRSGLGTLVADIRDKNSRCRIKPLDVLQPLYAHRFPIRSRKSGVSTVAANICMWSMWSMRLLYIRCVVSRSWEFIQ
jgi:hypothetical protein